MKPPVFPLPAVALSLALTVVFSAAPQTFGQEKSRTSPGKPAVKSAAATPAAPAEGAAAGAGAEAGATNLETGVRRQIEEFFTALEKHQVDDAYAQLLKGTRIAERTNEVANLKSKTQQAISLFGDVQGRELIEARSVGSRLLSVTYLSLGRDYPLRWRFYYYKPADTWRLIDIRVDDRLADMFEEPLPAGERNGESTLPGSP